MATEDVLARIDRIERRWEEERERWMARDVTLKTFLDELTRRHVGVTQEMIGALQGLQGEIVALQGEIGDQRQQIRANTEAVLRLLDERFGPEPPQG